LLRDSNKFTLAGLSKTCASLGNEFSSFGKPSIQMQQMLKECKDASGHIAMWQYLVLNNTNFSLGTTILEPGIGTIDTWYLVSPSTTDWVRDTTFR